MRKARLEGVYKAKGIKTILLNYRAAIRTQEKQSRDNYRKTEPVKYTQEK